VGFSPSQAQCSFCNKPQHRVKTLIASQDVCICNECIDLWVQIMVVDGHFDVRQHLQDFDPKAFLEEWISEINLQDTQQIAVVKALLERLLHRLTSPATAENQEP
jgi:ATP-dependent protease Clp ATPase subunit